VCKSCANIHTHTHTRYTHALMHTHTHTHTRTHTQGQHARPALNPPCRDIPPQGLDAASLPNPSQQQRTRRTYERTLPTRHETQARQWEPHAGPSRFGDLEWAHASQGGAGKGGSCDVCMCVRVRVCVCVKLCGYMLGLCLHVCVLVFAFSFNYMHTHTQTKCRGTPM